eukprot:6352618-Karenia_brevis.AAC.1
MAAPWHSTITASDASLYGLGGCRKTISPALVGQCGRVAEKWRFKSEDHIRARVSALGMHSS